MIGDAGTPIGRGLGDDWIVRRPGPRERRWFLLHGLMRGLFWLIPFLVVALIWVFWFEVSATDVVPAGILLLGVLILTFYIFWGLLFPKNWLVSIGPKEVMVQRGIIHLTRVFVSYDRVQQIDLSANPVMSSLDLTQMVLYSAAGGVRVYALDPRDADLIAERVRIEQPPVPEMFG